MKRRRVWGTAATAAVGLAGVLVFQGLDGGGTDDKRPAAASEQPGPGPVVTSARTADLRVADDGRTASLAQNSTKSFATIGVTWADPAAAVDGTVEVRTRDAGTGKWSDWVKLTADGGGEEGAKRGGTEPMWVGLSDGAEARVTANGKTSVGLPAGLRLDMIDSGKAGGSDMEPAAFSVPAAEQPETGQPVPSASAPAEPSSPSTGTPSATPSNSPVSPSTSPSSSVAPTGSAAPATGSTPTTSTPTTTPKPPATPTATPTPTTTIPPAPPSTNPRPAITSRAGWGADESISPEEPGYLPDGRVKAVVVHHTAGSNVYTCADAPKVVRGIYAYHVQQLGWRDIGYNFLVDKCGVVYEGRKGGVDRPVQGAHAYGFNAETTGISVLGTYTDAAPPMATMTAVARVAAWKLGQYGVNPTGTTTLTAGDSGLNYFGKSWAKGAKVTVPTINGHRDTSNTLCPGTAFYAQLPAIRTLTAGPPAGVVIKSVTGGAAVGATHYTKSAVTVTWGSSTPAALIAKWELIVDGKTVASAAGTATSAKATLSPGTHKVSVRATHQSGKATASALATVVAETTVPVFTTKPTLSLRTGTVNTNAVPLTLSWKATDAAALREVRLTAPVAKTYGPTTYSAAHTIAPGVAKTWSMTAQDQAGNTATASVAGTPVLLPETSAARTGTWSTSTNASFLGGKAYRSNVKNASLTWTFTGKSVAWVALRGAGSGQALVYVDGVKTATVDLKSATTKYRDVAWTKTWATSGKHTVKIVVVGTAGRPTVVTDGLVYLK